MKTIKLDEFYDERYIPLEEMFLVAVNQYYIEHQEELQGSFLACLQQTLQTTRTGAMLLVSKVYCTLQYTDFFAGVAKVNIYLCDEQGRVMTMGEWDCHWLLPLWHSFVKQVTDERGYVRSYIHPSMFRPFYVATLRQLMEVMTEYFKVWMSFCLQEIMADVSHTDEVLFTFGEYLGMQNVVGRLRPAVNLMKYTGQDDGATDELQYRYFGRNRYRVKTLGKLDLQHSIFQDCLFEPWRFKQTNLREVLFQNCRFHLTEFTQADLQGAIFVDCSFVDCHFYEVKVAGEASMYPMLFQDCQFDRVSICKCDWQGVEAENCVFSHMRTENCNLAEGLLVNMKMEGYIGG